MLTTRATKRATRPGGKDAVPLASNAIPRRAEMPPPESICPLAIAERVERFEVRRWQRRYAKDGRRFTRSSWRRSSGRVSQIRSRTTPSHCPQSGWWKIPAQELDAHRRFGGVLGASGLVETGSGKDTNVIRRCTTSATVHEPGAPRVESPTPLALALWDPVFALGPKGHYAVGHFLKCWFNQITETTIVAEFTQPGVRWSSSCCWARYGPTGPWYYGRQSDGTFWGSASRVVSSGFPITARLSKLHRICLKSGRRNGSPAMKTISHSADFSPLRWVRLFAWMGSWIAETMKTNADLGKWFRDQTSNVFLEFLDVLVSDHAAALAQNEKGRQALLELAAHAVSRQLTAALALQERIRRLF